MATRPYVRGAPGRTQAAPARSAARNVLFSAPEPTVARGGGPTTAAVDATALRRRVVAMDGRLLGRARDAAAQRTEPPVLTLNLFDDVVHEGIIEWTAPTFSGGYSISGRLADDPLGTVTLVVNGETVAGTVRTVRGTYRIRSVGGGLYAVSELDPSQTAMLEDDVLVPPDAGPEVFSEQVPDRGGR